MIVEVEAISALEMMLDAVRSGRMRIIGFNITIGNGFDSNGFTVDGRLVPIGPPEASFEIQVEGRAADLIDDVKRCEKCNREDVFVSECCRNDCLFKPFRPVPFQPDNVMEPVKATPPKRELIFDE